jgi:hypothetical protein
MVLREFICDDSVYRTIPRGWQSTGMPRAISDESLRLQTLEELSKTL